MQTQLQDADGDAQRRQGGSAHLVEMKAEPAALLAPGGQSPEKLSSKRKPNRLMMEVDTAIGPQERKPRKRVPSPASA